MFHVIYVSKPTKPFSQSELVDLLDVARNRNHRLLLTGLLLYSGESFMQVLEGKESAVQEVFSSIQKDSRHTDIVTLRLEAKANRHFPDWRMGFQDLNEETSDSRSISRFLEPGFNAMTFRDESSSVYQLLRAFRDDHFANLQNSL